MYRDFDALTYRNTPAYARAVVEATSQKRLMKHKVGTLENTSAATVVIRRRVQA